MPYTAIEKVMARVCRNPAQPDGVPADTLVFPDPDMVMIHDGLLREAKQMLDGIGIDRIHAPEKTMVVSDHDVLYGSARAAERGAFNRKAAKTWKIHNFYDAGQGGHGHIFPMEEGLVLPGMFYLDNDTHATNAGAVGAFGMRVGNEIARVLATGTTWITVPRSVKLELRGRLAPGVYARDVGFYFARAVKAGRIPFDLDYRVLEFAGDLDQFGLGARIALCSTATEMRAAGVFVPPSEEILRYCAAHAKRPYTPVYPDADARYEAVGTIDLADVGPQVVPPGDVTLAGDIDAALDTAIDHAFIGSCGSGAYDDLVVAASILKGRRLPQGLRLFVVPGTERSTRRLMSDGLMQIFMDAGAMVLPAGCGPCNDAVVGPLASGETSISTATNSNHGRFGPRDARLFLGSPATVAASAVAGRIADPRALRADAEVLALLENAYV
ncbi:3-isopropylmalate dehydratase large subunit [Bordetella genomosp. 13]|uniref:3-isopropylmalate dehydratase large subunit n=1 Tax=Bordetella genomosp. 13 TaxID=463040 RepID=UPI0011A45A02|nr:aconitase family protein [Bordetella genomosp. 13]